MRFANIQPSDHDLNIRVYVNVQVKKLIYLVSSANSKCTEARLKYHTISNLEKSCDKKVMTDDSLHVYCHRIGRPQFLTSCLKYFRN